LVLNLSIETLDMKATDSLSKNAEIVQKAMDSLQRDGEVLADEITTSGLDIFPYYESEKEENSDIYR